MKDAYNLVKLAFTREGVIFFQHPELAEQYLENPKQVKLIILEIMFANYEKIEDGLSKEVTWFKEKILDLKIPTIFYSELTREKQEVILTNHGINPRQYPCYNKYQHQLKI